MSLILQALKQLESKSPSGQELQTSDAAPDEQRASVDIDESLLASSPQDRWQPTTFSAGIPDRHTQAYDELAHNILSVSSTHQSVTLLLVSPDEGIGKTGMLVSLGRALVRQQAGEILLVDADFRKPDLAGRLAAENSTALADVLAGATNWRDVVRPTALAGLNVLPGRRWSATAEPAGQIASSIDLKPLLEQLSEHYRVILVDSSSLVHAEVAPMARVLSGTLLVVRLGKTTQRSAQASAQVIERCGGHVLGTVVLGG